MTATPPQPDPASAEPTPAANDDEPTLEALTADVLRLEEVIASWGDDTQRLQATALQHAVERLNAEALRRLIRAVKSDPAALAALKGAVQEDAVVRGVLQYHGLLKPPTPSLEARVAAALDAVRPSLESHGGDVELVAIEPPDVKVRLLGSCVGCPASMVTLIEGVEKAVKDRCPEIAHVVKVSGSAPRAAAEEGNVVGIVSPFALVRGKRAEERGWEPAGPEEAVPEGGVVSVDLGGDAYLLTRVDGTLHAYPNACAHLGMPLDMGEIEEGRFLVCPYHGFRYALDSGECLTAPEVQLPSLPVRTRNGRVEVKVRG